MKTFTRRQWVSLAAASSAVSMAAYSAWLEPRWLEITHTTVAAGFTAEKSIRILHLSDLHASIFVPMSLINEAISLGLQQRPDLVCLTGDFVTSQDGFDQEQYVHTLQRLSRVVPTYAVLGNHDGGRWAHSRSRLSDHTLVQRILALSGIPLLHNRSEAMRFAGGDLSLVGVGDLWTGEIDAASAFADLNSGAFTVLLSHNPDSKEVLKDYPWHLMLSGHTHGGQVIVPFRGPCYAPVQDKRYVAGLGQWRDRQIYVTRGVGNLGGVRFRCRPEISVITLA